MDEARSKKGEGRISRGTIKGREKGELAEARSKRREEGEGRISQGSSSLDHETISRDDVTPHKQLLVNKQTNKQTNGQTETRNWIDRKMDEEEICAANGASKEEKKA